MLYIAAVQLVEEKINKLESGNGCLMFSSGMSAISSVMQCFLKSGDHIIAPIHSYSATNELLTKWLPFHSDIEVSWIDTTKTEDGTGVDQYAAKIKSNTKMLYTESPSNPMNTVVDLSEFSKLAKRQSHEILTVVDSTFASPFNQLPLRDHELDIVIHSVTKILNGHSDVTAGTAVCREYEKYEKLAQFRRIYGNILSPFDCYLIDRGLRTLPIRADRINKSAVTVAQWIEQQDVVEKVHFCGLEGFEGHEVMKRNLRRRYDGDSALFWDFAPGFGGTFSFEISGVDRKLCGESLDELDMIIRAVSLGGTESLIEHPASMTHNDSMYETQDESVPQLSMPEGLVRLNIGLEPPELIIRDLEKMFDFVRKRHFICK